MEQKKIGTDTIARTIVAAITLLNTVLVMLGQAPLDLDESTIYTVVSGGAAILTTVWVWWKNQSFTQAALIGDEAMKEAKMMKKLAKAHADDEREDADKTA